MFQIKTYDLSASQLEASLTIFCMYLSTITPEGQPKKVSFFYRIVPLGADIPKINFFSVLLIPRLMGNQRHVR